jgi:hypothetical protein
MIGIIDRIDRIPLYTVRKIPVPTLTRIIIILITSIHVHMETRPLEPPPLLRSSPDSRNERPITQAIRMVVVVRPRQPRSILLMLC